MDTSGANEGFTVLVDDYDEATILVLRGELDLSTLPLFRERSIELAQRNRAAVVIDASGLTFIDSTGIHGLIEAESTIHQNGTKLSIVPSSQVERLLDMLGLERHFVTYPTVEAAIGFWRRPEARNDESR
ncbi:MAG TPA: STAS domain-containing protein [Acidimicrobiia bacterium]|nr:STAS domain-containing protein [Acidimicrobiia bacterium]